jgi:hypothetical protein
MSGVPVTSTLTPTQLVTQAPFFVIPAEAGISGPEVTALAHETPACAGVTRGLG